MVRLFRLAGEQAGTGRDIRPVFESRNIVCSGLGKLCFPLREIFSVTQNNLPARGLKTPPKSSFFTGHPVCRDRFSSDQRVLAIFTRNWLLRASFLHITAHKNGANPAKIYPVKGSIRFNFSRIKCPICSLVLVNSERLFKARLHKIWRYNTCFPAFQKEVSGTYFRCSIAQFPPSTRQRRAPKTARLRTKKGPVPKFETGPFCSNEAASTQSNPPRAA